MKHVPRACYERLHKYIVKIGFERKNDNNNLYIKIQKGKDILISEIFVDDIIFGGKDCWKIQMERSLLRGGVNQK